MNGYTKDQKKMVKYLKEQTTDGKRYFKSKDIAKDLDMTSYSIGVNLVRLSQKCRTLIITQWSATTSVTWRIEKTTKPVLSGV